MRNGIITTVTGWVATDPREIVEGSTAWTSFRLGVTPRRRDPVSNGWTDGRTEWVTVKAWRELAKNVVESVAKGQPIVVHGRLEVDEWTTNEGAQRRDLALHASHIGHDLTYGRATFVRRTHVSRADGALAVGAGADGPEEPGHDDPWAQDAVGVGTAGSDAPGPVGESAPEAAEAAAS